MKDYTGKVCGITGAACGIGKAFALYAAEKGMRLALIDIDDRVEDVRKECEAAGSPKAIAIKVDVSEYEQVRLSVKRIMDEFGQIDVFFSNAGVGGAGTLGNIPPQDWDWITSVNFLAMAYYATEIVPIMKKQGTEAHFLLTGSIGSLQPGMRIQSAYTASKHAALSLAESIRDYADHFAIIRMAYNLYCNGTPSVSDCENSDDQLSECRKYTVEDLFCCGYAPYFWQSVKLRYPEYCGCA